VKAVIGRTSRSGVHAPGVITVTYSLSPEDAAALTYALVLDPCLIVWPTNTTQTMSPRTGPRWVHRVGARPVAARRSLVMGRFRTQRGLPCRSACHDGRSGECGLAIAFRPEAIGEREEGQDRSGGRRDGEADEGKVANHGLNEEEQ